MLAKTMAFVNLRLARVAKCPGGYRIGQQFLERHHLRVPGPLVAGMLLGVHPPCLVISNICRSRRLTSFRAQADAQRCGAECESLFLVAVGMPVFLDRNLCSEFPSSNS